MLSVFSSTIAKGAVRVSLCTPHPPSSNLAQEMCPPSFFFLFSSSFIALFIYLKKQHDFKSSS